MLQVYNIKIHIFLRLYSNYSYYTYWLYYLYCMICLSLPHSQQLVPLTSLLLYCPAPCVLTGYQQFVLCASDLFCYYVLVVGLVCTGRASGRASQVVLVVKWYTACQCRRSKNCEFYPWVRKIPWRGHGSSLQCSCLENPMDRGAWKATVHGVQRSWTQLK